MMETCLGDCSTLPKGLQTRAGMAPFPGKLILSRKGFDSGYGGMPSPILPDGRLLPLPIPSGHDAFMLGAMNVHGVDLASLLADLSKGLHSPNTQVHMDPDLDRAPKLRLPGWRPALGQTGTAQSHLCSQGVGRGDVFLFFGWFRTVERTSGRWRFARGAPDLHVLFGWLEIDEMLPVVERRGNCLERFPWIVDHPHVANPAHYTDKRNMLYVAPDRSAYVIGRSGGGTFPQFSNTLQLTAAGTSRSVWKLPKWFFSGLSRSPLSCHSKTSRWSDEGNYCTLKSVAKGQEFVLDISDCDDGRHWVQRLIVENVGSQNCVAIVNR